MKTALTEYIEYLEEIKERDNIPNHVITTAKNYLETEEQQIIDATNFGLYSGGIDGETYYTSTFSTNKETLK